MFTIMQNFMGFLLRFTEAGYYIKTKGISKNMTQCNLCIHIGLSQARLQIVIKHGILLASSDF